MQQQQVIDRLQGVFDDVFLEKVELSPALSAKDVPEWDSITHVSLIIATEEAFGIRFRVGEVEATKNVGDLADLISKRLPQG